MTAEELLKLVAIHDRIADPTTECTRLIHALADELIVLLERVDTYRAEREAERDAKEALARRNEELAEMLQAAEDVLDQGCICVDGLNLDCMICNPPKP